MRLKTAVFYQSVQMFDGTQTQTIKSGQGVVIDLEDHLVKISKEGLKEVIVVPTANLRHSLADFNEAFTVNKAEEKPSQGNVKETKPKVNAKQ